MSEKRITFLHSGCNFFTLKSTFVGHPVFTLVQNTQPIFVLFLNWFGHWICFLGKQKKERERVRIVIVFVCAHRILVTYVNNVCASTSVSARILISQHKNVLRTLSKNRQARNYDLYTFGNQIWHVGKEGKKKL